MKLAAIARHLGCELEGDGDVEIRGAAGIEDAGPDEITFLSNPKYAAKIVSCRAGAIILSQESAAATSIPRLIAANPYLSFAKAIELFYRPPELISGIHPAATIAETAQIGENYSIDANAVIGEGVVIGENAVVHPNVIIYPYAQIGDDFVAHSHAVVREYCRIGSGVILQNGAVIGADGFGFAPRGDGSYRKILQAGIVVLEDNVEIGAHTCIDRATVGETRIGASTKIDNLVQIGHGSQVGEDTVLAAQVGLAGTTRVGNRVMLAGQVGVSGHLTIEDDVIATGQTGIGHDVKAGGRVSGSPEMDSGVWRRNTVIMRRLPELARTVRALEKKLRELEKAIQTEGDEVD